MTTDTLQRMKVRYREGSITYNEREDMLAELVRRNDAVEDAKANLKERWDSMLNHFLESLDEE